MYIQRVGDSSIHMFLTGGAGGSGDGAGGPGGSGGSSSGGAGGAGMSTTQYIHVFLTISIMVRLNANIFNRWGRWSGSHKRW
jgi:hypothetical protein